MDLEAKKAEILLKGQNLEQYIGKLQNELGAAQQELLKLQGELRRVESLMAPAPNPVPSLDEQEASKANEVERPDA